MINRYDEYLRLLKTNYRAAIKIEWLYEDETVMFELTEDVCDINGLLSVNMTNGTRSSATLKLNNFNNKFLVNPNSIWFNQKIKISMGLYLSDGTPFYIPKGVFYIKNPNEVFMPSEKTMTIHLVDKWSHLDGSLFGNLDGIYQTPVGSNIYTAITSLLKLDRGNGKPLDIKSPILSSYYLSKTWSTGGTVYNAINTPFTSRIDRGGSYGDVLEDYAKMLVAHIYYNENGNLVVEPTSEDILDETKPIQWEFNIDECEFLGSDITHNIDQVFNEILVVGAILNGKQAKGLAQNNNIFSDTRVAVIGRKCDKPYEDENYYADEQCQALAEYKLKQKTILQKTINIVSSPIYHIGVNKLVSIDRSRDEINPEKYLVSGYTLPIGPTGTMSISATNVNEFKF